MTPLRRRIDVIDDAIADLVNARVRVAVEVARVKAATGAKVRDREREAAVAAHYADRVYNVTRERSDALVAALLEISRAAMEGIDD